MAVLRHILVLVVGAWVLCAAPPPASEYEVKAAFLYNLAVLTEWPAGTWTKADEPLVIGVLGEDPFGPALERVLAGKRVNGRPIQLARWPKVAAVTTAHVVFVSGSAADEWPAIKAALAGRAVLTVGDREHFCREGGMVRLVKRADDTIGLHVNPDEAKAARLQLSARLQALAKIQPTER